MNATVFMLLWAIPTLYFGPKLGRLVFLPVIDRLVDPVLVRLMKRADRQAVQAHLDQLQLRAAWEVVAMEDEKNAVLERMQDVVEDSQFEARMKFESGWVFDRRDSNVS